MKSLYYNRKAQPKINPDAKTIVFVDYEYLFISFEHNYGMPPMLEDIYMELKAQGRVMRIYVVGDFTKEDLNKERQRVRTITSNIIDCSSESSVVKKDFTDFIMLDHIYQEMVQDPEIEQFILVTGDGHFSSVATFLRTFMEKTIGVYGVERSLSNQLCSCATWAKEFRALEEDDEVYSSNLLKSFKAAETRGIIPTFRKTAEHTQRVYGGDLYRYEAALRNLLENEIISSNRVDALTDRPPFISLCVNWDKVEKAKMLG